MAKNLQAGRRFPYYSAYIWVIAKNEKKKLSSASVQRSRDLMCQVCTLHWFRETETWIHLNPYLFPSL